MKNLALLAVAAYIAMSTLASIQPEWFEFIQGIPGRDKLLHFLGTGVLSTAIVLGFPSLVIRKRSYGSLPMLGAIALLVTLEEFAQLAIPSRTFDPADLYWSYLGIAVFGLTAIWLRRIRAPAV